MSKCDGITHVTITQDMMEKYPGLMDKGLEVGDKLTTGLVPFDGIVQGLTKQAGKCEKTCTFVTPAIDGNTPLTWESEFVQEFFPYELQKVENTTGDIPAPECYADPLRKFASGKFQDAIFANKESGEKEYDALRRFSSGAATLEDLKLIEGILSSAIKRMEGKGENSTPMKFALKLIQKEIKIKASKVADK